MSNKKQTSPKVATDASKQLTSSSSSKTQKEVAASDLSQAQGKGKGGKKSK
jgi:hypothetical protein